MTEVKTVTFTAFKGNQPYFAGSPLLQNQTDLLFDNNIDKNPFANLEIKRIRY